MPHRYRERTARWPRIVTVAALTAATSGVMAAGPPAAQYGLDPNGEAVLQNAVTEGATVTSVNIMVFDYYIAKEGVVEMGTAAETRPPAPTPSWSRSSRA